MFVTYWLTRESGACWICCTSCPLRGAAMRTIARRPAVRFPPAYVATVARSLRCAIGSLATAFIVAAASRVSFTFAAACACAMYVLSASWRPCPAACATYPAFAWSHVLRYTM